MLIYSGKSIFDKRMVTKIQRKSLTGKYVVAVENGRQWKKADDLKTGKESLPATKIRGQFRF